jgi:hypothetical protein
MPTVAMLPLSNRSPHRSSKNDATLLMVYCVAWKRLYHFKSQEAY